MYTTCRRLLAAPSLLAVRRLPFSPRYYCRLLSDTKRYLRMYDFLASSLRPTCRPRRIALPLRHTFALSTLRLLDSAFHCICSNSFLFVLFLVVSYHVISFRIFRHFISFIHSRRFWWEVVLFFGFLVFWFFFLRMGRPRS